MDEKKVISLFGADGKEMRFERVASVALGAKQYSVLAPLDPPAGMQSNQALVFEVSPEADGRARMQIVTDGQILNEVFEEYMAAALRKTEGQARRTDIY